MITASLGIWFIENSGYYLQIITAETQDYYFVPLSLASYRQLVKDNPTLKDELIKSDCLPTGTILLPSPFPQPSPFK